MNYSKIESHLRKFKVGIAGAGGLGSNCAIALARCGIGKIVICDFDHVEESNLSRQYFFREQIGLSKTAALKENIFRINPEVEVVAIHLKLDRNSIAAIFSECDVIVEAFDQADIKEMLIETVQYSMPDTPLVVGSGMAGWGNNNSLRSRKIDDTLYICGDETSEVSEDMPALAPRVGIVANMQANIVIEILMDRT